MKKLRKYQEQAVNALRDSNKKGFGIFFEPRLGKTLTVAAYSKESGHRFTLIVAPSITLAQWRDEYAGTGQEAVILSGTPKKRVALWAEARRAGVGIISYDTLVRDISHASGVDCIVVDEVHMIGNHKTKRAKTCVKIARNADKRIALSGTPVQGKVTRLFGVLQFMYPDAYTSYWKFQGKWLRTKFNGFTDEVVGIKPDMKDRLDYLMGMISVHGTQREHLHELDPIVHRTYTVLPSASYKKLLRDLSIFKEFTHAGVEYDAPTPATFFVRARQLTLIEKVQHVADWLDLEESKALVFLNFSSMAHQLADLLVQRGYKPIVITGRDTQSARQNKLARFRDGDTRTVLIGNIQAVGTGTTIDTAERTLFVEQALTPEEQIQAENRMRGTTKTSKGCDYMVIPGSVDVTIMDLLQNKQDINSIINRNDWSLIESIAKIKTKQ